MKVEVVQDGHPALHTPAQAVPEEMFGTPELADILKKMEDTLHAAPIGVAIAAPQIAIPYRIFLVRYDRMRAPDDAPLGDIDSEIPEVGVYINPEILRHSRRQVTMDEACLSVSGVYGNTKRYERATVQARDAAGNVFTRGAGGILAQAFQHEIDHLNGILFIDHATDITPIPEPHEEG